MISFLRRHTSTVVGETQGFGSAELRGGGSRVIILPSLGGKISALETAGRQWLWRSDVLPFAPPVDGSSYAETADSGGYDECFPTVAPCTLPSKVTRYGGLSLPDHGELWAQPAKFALETTDGTPRAHCVWMGRRMAYGFARTVSVESDGAIVMRYSVRNDGPVRLPYIWSAHPLFPLTPETRLILPEGAPARVWQTHGIELRATGAAYKWPRFFSPPHLVDLSRPDSVAKAYACKIFLDLPEGHGRAAIREGDAELEVTFDTREIPNFGIWINRHGWTAFRRKRPYLNFAFEPCIGAPDSLTEALGAWRADHWLEAGETRAWTLTWRGRVIEKEDEG